MSIGLVLNQLNIIEVIDGIPGYVWISSVFDYNEDMISTNERMITRTQPLLTALKRNNGVINHITQVLRATNSIINLERDVPKLFISIWN